MRSSVLLLHSFVKNAWIAAKYLGMKYINVIKYKTDTVMGLI
jgi:hypothetical protein